MDSAPKISVVMTAYNAATTVREAVDSILAQTFGQFEFIVIDDGSSDDTGSILDEYQRRDPRMRVYHQCNQGMIAALNWGCQLARAPYIARMDADDLSLPVRFERQLDYMEAHPEIGVLGAWISKLKDGATSAAWCPAASPRILKWQLFSGVCFAHPVVFMRRAVMESIGFYRPAAKFGEDLDLWLRASAITEFANVPEILLRYRVWQGSTSQVHRQSYGATQVILLADYISDFLGVAPPIEAVWGLRQLRVGPLPSDPKQIAATASLVEKLYVKYLQQNCLNAQEQREISFDAATKLASLALLALKVEASDCPTLLFRALKLDYRLLHPRGIWRGLEKVLAR